mmetsp:Transcript_61249/g.138168  ORF Transcript_61249/g.138168 Transcript_61249/m.138168 type:complete len:226 (+) Transcript_61249:145-822(+)
MAWWRLASPWPTCSDALLLPRSQSSVDCRIVSGAWRVGAARHEQRRVQRYPLRCHSHRCTWPPQGCAGSFLPGGRLAGGPSWRRTAAGRLRRRQRLDVHDLLVRARSAEGEEEHGSNCVPQRAAPLAHAHWWTAHLAEISPDAFPGRLRRRCVSSLCGASGGVAATEAGTGGRAGSSSSWRSRSCRVQIGLAGGGLFLCWIQRILLTLALATVRQPRERERESER